MLCKNPFVRDPSGKVFKVSLLSGDRDIALRGVPFPCGQCLPCRINRRRLWTHRLLLESYEHSDSIFITLTYADEYLPEFASLDKKASQLFLKRFRKYISPRKIRYYFCGEYGSQTHRPHYHAIIFGASLLDGEQVARAWPFGRVHVAECNRNTVQYVAGYVTKKFVKKEDDRVQEFARMSLRPGLGFGAVERLAALISDEKYKHLFQGNSTIPDGLRHGPTFLPFDRYIKGKLCQVLEYDADCAEYLSELTAKYLKAQRLDPDSLQPLVDMLLDESSGRNVQIERRFKIFNTRNKI